MQWPYWQQEFGVAFGLRAHEKRVWNLRQPDPQTGRNCSCGGSAASQTAKHYQAMLAEDGQMLPGYLPVVASCGANSDSPLVLRTSFHN
ncbi:hypothetical protein OROMI_008292 [Orobanche minor]